MDELDNAEKEVISLSISLIVIILCLVGTMSLSFNSAILMLGIFGSTILGVTTYFSIKAILEKIALKNKEQLANASFVERLSRIKNVKNIEIENAFKEANDNLKVIKTYGESFSSPVLKASCFRIIKNAEKILDRIADDPDDFKITRTWFKTILPETTSLISEMVKYEKNQNQLLISNQTNTLDSFELKMIDSINGIADNFEKVLHSTNENDTTSLEVKMSVLNDFMKEHSR